MSASPRKTKRPRLETDTGLDDSQEAVELVGDENGEEGMEEEDAGPTRPLLTKLHPSQRGTKNSPTKQTTEEQKAAIREEYDAFGNGTREEPNELAVRGKEENASWASLTSERMAQSVARSLAKTSDAYRKRDMCPMCASTFGSSAEWKGHIWTAHEGLIGLYGEMAFNVPALLLQHLDRLPFGPLKTPEVNVYRLPASSYELDPETVATAACHRCPACEAHFATLQALQIHADDFHGHQPDALVRSETAQVSFFAPEQMLCCGVCCGLVQVRELGSHLASHHPITGGLICPFSNPALDTNVPGNMCDVAVFGTAAGYRAHLVKAHRPPARVTLGSSAAVRVRRLVPMMQWVCRAPEDVPVVDRPIEERFNALVVPEEHPGLHNPYGAEDTAPQIFGRTEEELEAGLAGITGIMGAAREVEQEAKRGRGRPPKYPPPAGPVNGEAAIELLSQPRSEPRLIAPRPAQGTPNPPPPQPSGAVLNSAGQVSFRCPGEYSPAKGTLTIPWPPTDNLAHCLAVYASVRPRPTTKPTATPRVNSRIMVPARPPHKLSKVTKVTKTPARMSTGGKPKISGAKTPVSMAPAKGRKRAHSASAKPSREELLASIRHPEPHLRRLTMERVGLLAVTHQLSNADELYRQLEALEAKAPSADARTTSVSTRAQWKRYQTSEAKRAKVEARSKSPERRPPNTCPEAVLLKIYPELAPRLAGATSKSVCPTLPPAGSVFEEEAEEPGSLTGELGSLTGGTDGSVVEAATRPRFCMEVEEEPTDLAGQSEASAVSMRTEVAAKLSHFLAPGTSMDEPVEAEGPTEAQPKNQIKLEMDNEQEGV